VAVCLGCGLDVDPDTGVLELQLKSGGGLVCDGDGLSVAFPSVDALDPISPDACNGIARRGNGLYAPCPDASTGTANCTLANLDYDPAPPTPPDTQNEYEFVSTSAVTDQGTVGGVVTMTNPTCCQITGRIGVRAGGLYGLAQDGFYGAAELRVNQGGGGLTGAGPDTHIVFENQCGSPVHTSFNNMVDENWIVIDPGDTFTYAASILFLVYAGNIHLSGTINFEFNWVLVQTGCC